MKVKTLKKFRDLKEGKVRKAGEIFTVSKDRFAEIEKAHKGLVEEVKEEKPEEDTPEEEKPEE